MPTSHSDEPVKPLDSPYHRRGWKTGDFVRAAIVAIGVWALANLLFSIHTLVFAAFLGLLFGLGVAAGADWLERFRIPRIVGAPFIIVSAIALLVGFFMWTGPTVRDQYDELRQKLPEAIAKFDQWIGDHQDGWMGSLLPGEGTKPVDSTTVTAKTELAVDEPPSQQTVDTSIAVVRVQSDSLANIKSLGTSLTGSLSSATKFIFPVISSTLAVLSGIILVLFLSIYIAVNPSQYRSGLVALAPPRSRKRFDKVLGESATELRKWLVTQLIAMVTIGTVTTITLLILDVKAALPLGIIAGLLEFVPTIGPILSAVPAIIMGFADSPEKALVVTIAYIAIQFVENHLLIPILMKEGVDLPPVLTVLVQALMAIVFGFMGLFVAVPMLVLVTVMVKKLYVEPNDEIAAAEEAQA